MGCNNTNVKEDIININKNELEENKENINNNILNKKNQEDIESNLNDLEINKNNKNNGDSIDLQKGETKTILNLYTNKITRPKIYEVPKIIIFEKKGPEDKKPPDINKLKEKRKNKTTYDYENLIINNNITNNVYNKNKKKKKKMKVVI